VEPALGDKMNVVEATANYDHWLAQRLKVIVKSDLKLKHRQMSENAG
jgi:hypothetical protein